MESKKSQLNDIKIEKDTSLSNLDEIFSFLYGLKEKIVEYCRKIQDVLEKNNFNEELQQFLGAVHGFLDDLSLFLKVIGVVEGKVRGELFGEKKVKPATPTEEHRIMAKLGQLSKEYVQMEKEKDQIADFTKLELLNRSETVGSTYEPEFLVEEILRGIGYVKNTPKIYSDIQEAYDVVVGKDPNINEEQKEKVKEILKKYGYNVK